jgi:hypothetical protein
VGTLHKGPELVPGRLVDIQGSSQVLAVEALVFGTEPLFFDRAYVDQILAPGVLAVAGQ